MRIACMHLLGSVHGVKLRRASRALRQHEKQSCRQACKRDSKPAPHHSQGRRAWAPAVESMLVSWEHNLWERNTKRKAKHDLSPMCRRVSCESVMSSRQPIACAPRACLPRLVSVRAAKLRQKNVPNIHRYTHAHTCVQSCMYACMHCMLACKHIHAYIHTHTHAHTHTHIYIYIYI